MEKNITKGSNEASALISSVAQSSRFKERDQKKADSVIHNSEVVYFSPVIKIDAETSAAIIQYRDSETGAVENEYPSPRQVDSYKKAAPQEPVVVAAPVAEAKKPIKVEKPIVEHIDAEI
jgi:hypothetical protein